METYVKPNVASKETLVPHPVIGPDPGPFPLIKKLIGDDDLYPAQALTPRKSVE